MGDDELLAELTGAAGSADITELRHVRPAAEKRAAEEIANRERCEDFDTFKPLFDKVQTDIGAGLRRAILNAYPQADVIIHKDVVGET